MPAHVLLYRWAARGFDLRSWPGFRRMSSTSACRSR